MPKTITLTHHYDHPPQAVWDVATDFDAFVEATKRLVSFDGLPTEPMFEGQKIDVTFRLFGKLPPQPYHMELVVFDPEAHRFESHEYGGAVKSWNHTLTVTETAMGSVLTDRVEIDAGWMTPIYAAYGRFMYRQRHPVRVRLLAASALDRAVAET
ncbi:SRPBCC family protein [Loktanella sp. F6476L]|uniref:SRPBCC family protein n=1 Tax=Loktanella sp. F6476L TaxID=2926405 RepID=UPI001FF5AF44|nr:SRPBCC family protein [Loktanella sp. F6476L]MCK0119333.1 SRPBCC family protein [Loktanella sp. F6476L]